MRRPEAVFLDAPFVVVKVDEGLYGLANVFGGQKYLAIQGGVGPTQHADFIRTKVEFAKLGGLRWAFLELGMGSDHAKWSI